MTTIPQKLELYIFRHFFGIQVLKTTVFSVANKFCTQTNILQKENLSSEHKFLSIAKLKSLRRTKFVCFVVFIKNLAFAAGRYQKFRIVSDQ